MKLTAVYIALFIKIQIQIQIQIYHSIIFNLT